MRQSENDTNGTDMLNLIPYSQGASTNCFLDLINIDQLSPANSIPRGLHRSVDPGVGAFSSYHNRVTVAISPIKAYQELYLDYGEGW